MMFHSIRARLTFWYTAILAFVLVVFSGICYALLARGIRSATDASLAAGERETLIVAADGHLAGASAPRLTAEERRRVVAAIARGALGFGTVAGGVDEDGIRFHATKVGPDTVVVAVDLDEQADRLEDAAHAVLLGIPLTLLLAAGGGYVLARQSLRPVTMMSQKARQIGAETLAERITVANDRDELGYLATTLNDLLERLQRSFESQRRFMADASHELRTPLAIIQGEVDVALSRADRSADDYRESLEMIRGAAQKLTQLVQNLFLLARSDAGSYPIAPTRFYLEELVAKCVRSMRSVAAANGVELCAHLSPDLALTADEALIDRLLLNLIDNAVKFTPPGGSVAITAAAQNGSYVIRVSDTGSGIPPADQSHIFERFYRVDRVRPSTGAGLGLPIARWIAEAHGGVLELEKSDQRGSVFTATLPATH